MGALEDVRAFFESKGHTSEATQVMAFADNITYLSCQCNSRHYCCLNVLIIIDQSFLVVDIVCNSQHCFYHVETVYNCVHYIIEDSGS